MTTTLTTSARCLDGHGRRHNHPAEGWLHAPSGDRVPGPGMCRKHAEVVIAEYATKLGESWTFVAGP